jgi:hypothetical protein
LEEIIMRRLAVIAMLGTVLAMLAGAMTASPAFARGHKWQVVPVQPFTLGPGFCGFGVKVTPVVSKEFSKILKASDGSMTTLTTGAATASFTNLQTGKTITENISGPAKITTPGDGSATVAAKGRNLFVLVPADATRFGLPTVMVSAGALTSSFVPDGSLASLSLHGHVLMDVCAALR